LNNQKYDHLNLLHKSNRRDLLKAMALLPLASCTSAVDKTGLPAVMDATPTPTGWITPAMKVARLGEWFNIRTAWHGQDSEKPPARIVTRS
jgi:hypothetical protein